MTVPLYRRMNGAPSWLAASRAQGANAGLVFDKFFSGWGNGFANIDDGEKQSWVNRLVGMPVPTVETAEVATRRQSLLTARGAAVWYAVATSRFVTGTGIANPLENGFAFHHTLGAPYLTASGLKGSLRAYWEQWRDLPDQARIDHIFGRKGIGRVAPEVGAAVFFDMLPVAGVRFVAEVMTPHDGGWYQDASIPPADWHSPIPIPFLAVEQGAVFRIAIAPRVKDCPQWANDKTAIRTALNDALVFTGLGAKTAVGYGRFELCDTVVAALARGADIARAVLQEWTPPAAATPADIAPARTETAAQPTRPTQGRGGQSASRPAQRPARVAPVSTYLAGQTLEKGTELTWSTAGERVRTTKSIVLVARMRIEVVLVEDASDVTIVSIGELTELSHIR